MPNSSARCAQLPRAVDKVPFYVALKKFRDHLRGDLPELEESEVTFPDVKLQNFNNKRIKENAESEVVMDEHGQRIDPETGKKRRGRPPKARPDGSLPPPKKKRVDEFGKPLPKGSNPIDPVTGKKKRGRPKKSDLPPAIMTNGMDRFQPVKDEDSDILSSKTSIKLPPFSPNFGGGKDSESDKGGGGASPHRPDSAHAHNRLVPGHSLDQPGLPGDTAESGASAKNFSREDEPGPGLPDLAGRLGGGLGEAGPCGSLGSPPASPGGAKSLSGSQFEAPRSLHEEETSHSSEDRRPDSARSLTRPQLPCGGNFSNPTTPVDVHGVQNYQNQQQRFSPFQRSGGGGGGPHQSPNYQAAPHNFHAPYRNTGQVQGTPPHRGFDSPGPSSLVVRGNN